MATEATTFKPGDRVVTTALARLHTHDGVFDRPAGTTGVVDSVHPDGEVRVLLDPSHHYNVGYQPDDLRRQEGDDA